MGKLIILSAPSGSGKTTICRHVLQKIPNLEFSISAASRAKRDNEQNGVDYYFMTADKFRQRIEKDEFVEWEEVYENNFYGTLKSEIQRIWDKGNHVIFDVDVVGGVNLKNIYKDKALAIFVKPPSIDELQKRLIARSSNTKDDIKRRIDKAEYELTFSDKFDNVIVNDNLETAQAETVEIINQFISK